MNNVSKLNQLYYLYTATLIPYFLNKNFPKIGDKVSLKISSKDHADVFFEKSLFQKIRYWGTVIGMIIICMGILLFIFL